MASMSVGWVLIGGGWVLCTVADDRGEAEVPISYLTTAPEDLLAAVSRLVLGAPEAMVQFEAEPSAFRWWFRCDHGEVWMRLLEVPDGRRPDEAGSEIWSSQQAVGTLARVVIRCFDEVAHRHGDQSYQDSWGSPFPHRELEHLRSVWRDRHPTRTA